MLGHNSPLATTVRRPRLGRPGKRGTSGGGRVSGDALRKPLFTLNCRQFRAQKPAGGASGGGALSQRPVSAAKSAMRRPTLPLPGPELGARAEPLQAPHGLGQVRPQRRARAQHQHHDRLDQTRPGLERPGVAARARQARRAQRTLPLPLALCRLRRLRRGRPRPAPALANKRGRLLQLLVRRAGGRAGAGAGRSSALAAGTDQRRGRTEVALRAGHAPECGLASHFPPIC